VYAHRITPQRHKTALTVHLVSDLDAEFQAHNGRERES